MSLGYQSKCDGCGKLVEYWPNSGPVQDGWACVQFSDSDILNHGQRLDYCPDCWAKMFVSLFPEKA